MTEAVYRKTSTDSLKGSDINIDVDAVKIRAATTLDLDRIMEIEESCFPGELAYKKKQMKYLVLRANCVTLVETSNNIIRGFVMVLYRSGSSVGGIETIDVDPQFRGLGVGKRLLEAAEDDMRRRRMVQSRLEVAVTNYPAIKLYEKAGYKIVKLMKDYYRFEHDGSRDAYRLIKNLNLNL
ncbi:MAG: N-acetyltransferase [Thermoplasmata archaeon]